MNQKKAKNTVKKLVVWLDNYFTSSNILSAVFGVSGGLDSAVVAGLLARCRNVQPVGLILPIESVPLDKELAEKVLKKFGISFFNFNLEGAYKSLLPALGLSKAYEESHDSFEWRQKFKFATGNIKARLRMVALYNEARMSNGIVIATGNLSEFLQGFTTLHGDTGDIAPLGQLWKGSEILAIAKYLGVPQEIINRPPSDGLGISSTDKDQLLLDYPELDKVLRIFLEKRLVPDLNKRKFISAEAKLPLIDGIPPEIVKNVFERMYFNTFKRLYLRLPMPTRSELGLDPPYYE